MSIPTFGVEPREEKGLLDFFKALAGLFIKPDVEKDRISIFGLPVIEAGEQPTGISPEDQELLNMLRQKYPTLALIRPEAVPDPFVSVPSIFGGADILGGLGQNFGRILSFLEQMAPLIFMSLLLQLGNMSMLQDRLSRQVDED